MSQRLGAEVYPRGLARQDLRLGILVTFVVLAVGACGGGGGQEEAKARPLPEEGKELHPGAYRSQQFEPSFSFRVGKGWTADLDISNALAIRQGEDVEGERALLGFANVKELYKPGTLNVTKAPKDMVVWFQRHPYLRTTEPEPVTVGGVKGVRFDVVVDELPEDYYGVCGSGCVDLFKVSSDHNHVIFQGEKQRLLVVESVRGETVTIVFATMASKFDEVAPQAQKVIDSVEWRAS